jgi:hypothetical protein
VEEFQSRTKAVLIHLVIANWNALNMAVVNNLVDPVPKTLQEVIRKHWIGPIPDCPTLDGMDRNDQILRNDKPISDQNGFKFYQALAHRVHCFREHCIGI